MNLYEKYLLPRIIHYICGMKPSMRQREKIVPLATGRVLEVGAGSGLNLPYYPSGCVEKLWALDPCEEIWALAEAAIRELEFPVEFVCSPAEEIPLDSQSMDTIVVTHSLCTIPEPRTALGEMRRVLRPGGRLLFCEHGAAPDAAVRRWQDRLNPLWRGLGGGCNLNRDIPAMLEGGGFEIQEIATMYIPGWRFASFNYWGVAG